MSTSPADIESADLSLSPRERRLAGVERLQPLWFDAVLRPHRSLDRRGFLILLGVVFAIAGLSVLRFLVLGAWPVAVFFLLDAGLIYGAFRLSYATARAFEVVQLSRDALIVVKVDWRGRARSWSFNPDWMRITVAGDADRPETVTVEERDARAVVAACLSPPERADFAAALGAARRGMLDGKPPLNAS